MDTLLFTSLTEEDLQSKIAAAVEKTLEKHLSAYRMPIHMPQEFLTRKDAAKLLGVSLKTLNEWTKEGIVPAHRIASRVRYKRSEVESSLCQVRSAKRA